MTKDFRDTIKKIFAKGELINTNLTNFYRVEIRKKIKIIGEQEKREESNSYFRQRVDRKKRYVDGMSYLIDETNLGYFYGDLDFGLDVVIERWDGSTSHPQEHDYRNNPQQVIRIYKYKKRRN